MSADANVWERLGEFKSRIDALEKGNAALTARVAKLERGAPAGNGATSGGGGGQSDRVQAASDADLDGQHGNPEVRYDPKDKHWSGASYVGRRFSECPADYLDAMAKSLEASAYGLEKGAEEDPTDAEAKRKKARFKRLDAARAKGWAARVRAGRVSHTMVPARSDGSRRLEAPADTFESEYGDESVPF